MRDACVTPGSRSTPLTIALAEQSAIRPWLHLDERSSAFFALGLARASGRPVALVCTSGTAAVNFHPAVVEADLSRVPLIVCTADRPLRLRNVGAPQTIDQVGLYGVSVRHERDLPVAWLPGRSTQPSSQRLPATRSRPRSVRCPAPSTSTSPSRSPSSRLPRTTPTPLPPPLAAPSPLSRPWLRSRTHLPRQRRRSTPASGPLSLPAPRVVASPPSRSRPSRAPLARPCSPTPSVASAPAPTTAHRSSTPTTPSSVTRVLMPLRLTVSCASGRRPRRRRSTSSWHAPRTRPTSSATCPAPSATRCGNDPPPDRGRPIRGGRPNRGRLGRT